MPMPLQPFQPSDAYTFNIFIYNILYNVLYNILYNMECVICLDDISCNCNDYCKFNCCNNSAHILCLNSWIVNNIDNKNIHKCFICNQDNNAIKNIMSLYSYNSDEIYEIINGNINNISTTNIYIIDISGNNSQAIPYTPSYIETRYFCMLKIIYSSLTVSMLLLGFIYISPYYKN